MKRKHLYTLTAAISLSAILAACGEQNSSSSDSGIESQKSTYTIDEAQKQVTKIMTDISTNPTVLSDKLIKIEDDSSMKIEIAYSLGENGELEKFYDSGNNFISGFKYIKGEEPILTNGDKPTEEEKEVILEDVNAYASELKADRSLFSSTINPFIEGSLISSEENNGVYTFVYDVVAEKDEEETGLFESAVPNVEGTFTVKMDKSLNILGWEIKILEEIKILDEMKITLSDYKW